MTYLELYFDHVCVAEYDSLSRLGITDPKVFIKKRFKSELLSYLDTCCVGSGIKEQIEASVDEALRANSWMDIMVSTHRLISSLLL